jgi:hypothetical protein
MKAVYIHYNEDGLIWFSLHAREEGLKPLLKTTYEGINKIRSRFSITDDKLSYAIPGTTSPHRTVSVDDLARQFASTARPFGIPHQNLH